MNNTKMVFKIVSEGAVAAGIVVLKLLQVMLSRILCNTEILLSEIKMTLKNPQDVGKAVIALQEDNAKLRKQLEAMLKDKAKNMKTELAQEIQEVNGIQFQNK
jgi:alanyl-tRNA synthetase